MRRKTIYAVYVQDVRQLVFPCCLYMLCGLCGGACVLTKPSESLHRLRDASTNQTGWMQVNISAVAHELHAEFHSLLTPRRDEIAMASDQADDRVEDGAVCWFL